MLRASGVFAIALLVDLVVVSGVARAGNSDDVVAGSDVALTGGAVVANVHTGGAMWFNPAGVARLDARSVDLTGAVLSYNIISAPGVLSIESGEQSEGDFSALQAIPRALTFVASPRPALRWGIGFFFSRSLSRFLQDSVATQSDSLEPSEFYATADETKSLYHLSSALAWKKSDKFLLGGGFDIVVADPTAHRDHIRSLWGERRRGERRRGNVQQESQPGDLGRRHADEARAPMGADPRSADRLDGRDAELPRLPQQRDDSDGAALAARR